MAAGIGLVTVLALGPLGMAPAEAGPVGGPLTFSCTVNLALPTTPPSGSCNFTAVNVIPLAGPNGVVLVSVVRGTAAVGVSCTIGGLAPVGGLTPGVYVFTYYRAGFCTLSLAVNGEGAAASATAS
jgi:hypothetical protein